MVVGGVRGERPSMGGRSGSTRSGNKSERIRNANLSCQENNIREILQILNMNMRVGRQLRDPMEGVDFMIGDALRSLF